MNFLLGAGGGFLVAVLWMDLMFDLLVFRGGNRSGRDELPEDALAQISTYYRRVTTTATPMNHLITAVMVAMIGTLGLELFRGQRVAVTLVSLALCAIPIGFALLRIFPSAIRLGSRKDDAAGQTRLARQIATAHLVCLAAMTAFVVLRFVAGSD